MAKDALHGELDDVIKRIEDAAYQRGWADAIKHVMTAAQSAHAAPTAPQAVAPVRRERKAAYGAIGEIIDSALTAFDDYGVSPGDVVDHGREKFDENLLESSVRGRLNRMVKAGELRKERGRCFRVRQSGTGRESEDAAASSVDTDSELFPQRPHDVAA